VNPKNPTTNVTLRELREILLGDRQWWACKQPHITLTAMPRGSAERDTLTRTIYKMDDAAFDKYFFFEVYRGLLPTSPTILDTAAEVKKFVSRTPGAVGYVRASEVDDSVKVLRIDGLFPEDDGYPLRLRTRVAK
jgi:phosphate transport system substrate-binding protein